MGGNSSKENKPTKDQVLRSRKIDEQLRAYRKIEDETTKLLLLGRYNGFYALRIFVRRF